MIPSFPASYTTFAGFNRLASGSLLTNASAMIIALKNPASGPVLIFDDATGRVVDVDMRGSEDEILARLPATVEVVPPSLSTATPKGPQERGRPKLGVVGREVTLLPRHWEWLASQPGGASVALRKLVEQARTQNADKDKIRHAQERAYSFISAVAGNLPHFEEAARALFAGDRSKFTDIIKNWPGDVPEHAIRLAFSADEFESVAG